MLLVSDLAIFTAFNHHYRSGENVSEWHKNSSGKTDLSEFRPQSSENSANVDVNCALTAPADEIWMQVQNKLVNMLGARVHKSWTGQLDLQSADEETVVLTAPSKFVAGRIDERYGELVRSLWMEFDARRVSIEMAAPKRSRPSLQAGKGRRSPAKAAYAASHPQRQTHRAGVSPSETASPPPSLRATSPKVNAERFTFENFVVGSSNELAYAVARRCAMSTEIQYNPIVIYGPHGMGKTHLLHAVKSKVKEETPARRVRLISSEDFVASFVHSVRSQGRSQIDAFKSSLRDVDLLIIDDAHFIADKPSSQEELMHTLISLVESGKQILLASDRHPLEIDKASARLKSYLCGGLLCDIGPADYDLRRRILDRLIERRRQNGQPSLAMPQDARNHLAARINATPRDLEGAFNQVVARLDFLGKPLTLDSIQEALAHSRYLGRTRPTVDKIQKATVAHFNISMDELLSKRRARIIARPRQIAMYLSKQLTTRSLPDIGRRFGGRDHTTVIHAVKRIEALMAEKPEIKTQVEAIKEALTGAKLPV